MAQAKKDDIKADAQAAGKAEAPAAAEKGKAAEAAVEYLVAKSRHGAPYRRCGRLFDAEAVKIAVEELSEDDINRLNNDPHLIVHFETAEAE